MKSTIFFFLLGTVALRAQIGINTNNPQTVFHVDGSKDNALTGTPSDTQVANDFVVTNEGKVGIGTITPQANLEVKGKVILSGVKDNQLVVSNKSLAIDNTTGELGYVNPTESQVLYRRTAASRVDQPFNNTNWIMAPINTNGTDDINTLLATVETSGAYEYVRLPSTGIYRVELFGYLQTNTSYTAQALTTHIRLRKSSNSGSAWTPVDNQKVLNQYYVGGAANVMQPFVYVGRFNANDWIVFEMGTESNVTATGGWSKPNTNQNSIQLIITKL
jgi:hypothetical protein